MSITGEYPFEPRPGGPGGGSDQASVASPLVGSLVTWLAGYLLGVRRYGPAPMAAILAGGVLAGLAARWLGENQGLHQFNRQLLTTSQGTLLHAPLALAGDTAAAVWPPNASLPAVASWPLAAWPLARGSALIQGHS